LIKFSAWQGSYEAEGVSVTFTVTITNACSSMVLAPADTIAD